MMYKIPFFDWNPIMVFHRGRRDEEADGRGVEEEGRGAGKPF